MSSNFNSCNHSKWLSSQPHPHIVHTLALPSGLSLDLAAESHETQKSKPQRSRLLKASCKLCMSQVALLLHCQGRGNPATLAAAAGAGEFQPGHVLSHMGCLAKTKNLWHEHCHNPAMILRTTLLHLGSCRDCKQPGHPTINHN